MTIYERFGRKQEQYEHECEQHLESIALIGKLARGEVQPCQLVVSENSWAIQPIVKIEPPPPSEHPRPEPE